MSSKQKSEFDDNVVIAGVSSDCSANSEPGTVNRKRKLVKTTDRQLEMLTSFIQKYGDFTQGKPDENLLTGWDNLTKELNALGPPYRTNSEWRKQWSDHKGNVRRKALASNIIHEPRPRPVDPLNQRSNRSDEKSQNIHSSGIEKRLDAVIQHQEETEKKLDTITELLKELVEIFRQQNLDPSVDIDDLV